MHVHADLAMRAVAPLPALDDIAATLDDHEPAEDASRPEHGPDRYTLLRNPLTGRLMPFNMPPSEAGTLIDLFEAIRQAALEDGRREATAAMVSPGEASALRNLVLDASLIASDIRGLAYLFGKALDDDGRDDALTAASRVVVNCLGTMADRLVSLDEQASMLRSAPAGPASP